MSYPPYGPYGGQPAAPYERNLVLAKEGVHKLYLASLIGIIAAIVAVIMFVVLLLGMTTASSVSVTVITSSPGSAVTGWKQAASPRASPSMGAVIASLTGILLTFIVVLIVEFILVYKGFGLLSRYRPEEYSIGFTGVKLVLVGLGLVFLGALLVIVQLSLTIILVLLGFIVVFIGRVLVWIALWRLGEEWNEGLVKAGVIVEVVSIVIRVLTIVAAILYVIGFRSVEDKIEKAIREGSQQPSPYGGYASPYGP